MGIMATLSMMLILLTGTYAWTQFNNAGFNRSMGIIARGSAS